MLRIHASHSCKLHDFACAAASARRRFLTHCEPSIKGRHIRPDGAATIRWQSNGPARRANQALLPELLNVYRAGSAATITIGFGRVAAVFVLLGGVVMVPATIPFSSDVSNWLIVPLMLGACVPLVVTTLATGPMVHDIKIKLPAAARRSREALKSFVKRLPPDTILRTTYMRFVPWPVSSDLILSDLRRVQPSWKRGVANLEHLPKSMKGQEKHPAYWPMRITYARYYVNRNQTKEKSAATGIWDTIWEQIPGTVGEQKAKRKSTPGADAVVNRAAGSSAKPFAYPRVPLPKR